MAKKIKEREVILQIQEEIKKQREIGGFWDGYCNLQKVVSGDIWESSTRYVYELLQNAEDANATRFQIYVSKNRAKIIHNGRLFTPDDVRNLCYAASKKDPNESIGYLGVGFRSVFPVTDRPEIYSGNYSFRFDKEECTQEFGDSSLYYFYPYWIEQPTEKIDRKQTTFILPFKTDEYYTKTVEQLEELGIHSLLFLRNIKNILIHNEENNESRVCNITCLEDFKPLLNNPNIRVGKFLLVDGDVATRFLVFRGVFQIPDEIRNDEETIRAKRGEIREREVSIAFQLDGQDNLKPMDGCICSFFPIKERKINFLVHADFIVQAGRIALLDNKWNRWMMEKAKEVAIASYSYFEECPDEPKWAEQFPIVFEKRQEVGDIYEEVFETPLREATENPMVTDIEGKRIPLDRAIKITEETDELVKRGFVKCSDLEVIFEEEYHLIRKDYPTGGRNVRELKIDDFNCTEFIEQKIKEGNAIDFLRIFYSQYEKALERRYRRYARAHREEFIRTELGELLVIDREGNVRGQDDVWVEPDLKIFSELKGKGFDMDRILSQFNLVDKTLWKHCKKYLPKIKEISKETIVEESILPKLKTTSVRPSKEDILSWTYLLKRYGVLPQEEIWVLDSKERVKSSGEVFLADRYEPLYEWEKFHFPKINFLSEEYLNLENDPEGWKEFFRGTLMKGYESKDYQDYVEDNILPPLQDDESIEKLSIPKIIRYTRALKDCDFIPSEPIFVVTKDGKKIKSNCDLYFPSQYSPKENWENQSIIPLQFISPEYIGDDDASEWKKYFRKIGIKEEVASEIITEFAKAVVRRKFEKEGYVVQPYGGFADLVAKKENITLYIEVKGSTSGEVSDVNFDSNRTRFARNIGEHYYLAKVVNIPDAPVIYLLKDPANCEDVTLQMHISATTIEKYSEKIDAHDLMKFTYPRTSNDIAKRRYKNENI